MVIEPPLPHSIVARNHPRRMSGNRYGDDSLAVVRGCCDVAYSAINVASTRYVNRILRRYRFGSLAERSFVRELSFERIIIAPDLILSLKQTYAQLRLTRDKDGETSRGGSA